MNDKPKPVATTYPTAYAVSCFPPEHPEAYHFTIHVEWRDKDRWAVKHGSYVYDIDGVREYERQPSSRTDEFKERFRHSFATALSLASRLAPEIIVNGHTVEEVLAWGVDGV